MSNVMKTGFIKNSVQRSLCTIFLAIILSGCKEDKITLPLMGQIWGVVSLEAQEAGVSESEMVRKHDRSSEAILIFDGDTVSRQIIESTGFFAGGDFSFPDLREGSYDLIIRKEGFITRHFTGIVLDRENKYARGLIALFITPPMIIDSLDFELVPHSNTRAFGLAIMAKFSQWTMIGPDYFVALLSGTKGFLPGNEDFRINLQTYEETIRDTVFYYNVPEYVPGDTVYVSFIPQARSSHFGTETVFGNGATEVGVPYLKMTNIITGNALFP